MSFLTRVVVAVPLLASLVLGVTYDIKVGNQGLNYDPEEVTAAEGDILRFSFYPREHNVAQGSFDQPCKPMQGGIFSGDIEVENGVSMMTFDVTVNNTDPIWIYCSESSHCNGGMAMVVNAPSDQTLMQYKEAARNADPEDPEEISGGVFMAAAQTTDAAASASSVASSAMSVVSSATAAAGSATATGMAEMLRVNPGWLAALGLGGVAVAGLV